MTETWISPARRRATEDVAAAVDALRRITEAELLEAMDAADRAVDVGERVSAMLPAAPTAPRLRVPPGLADADEQPELPARRAPAKRRAGLAVAKEG